MEDLLTFEVEKEYLQGQVYRYPVASDGSKDGDNYDVDAEEVGVKVVIGFTVNVYNGMEHINTKFYPVKSDMNAHPLCDDTGTYTYRNNEDEVLAQIANDFPPYEYNCFNW